MDIITVWISLRSSGWKKDFLLGIDFSEVSRSKILSASLGVFVTARCKKGSAYNVEIPHGNEYVTQSGPNKGASSTLEAPLKENANSPIEN